MSAADASPGSAAASTATAGSGTPASQRYAAASATTRERTAHAVEYYNNNVLRARVGAGLAVRSSVHERHLQNGRHHMQPPPQQQKHAPHQQQQYVSSIISRLYPAENLYRSNSSLELQHDSSGGGGGAASSSSSGGNLHRVIGGNSQHMQSQQQQHNHNNGGPHHLSGGAPNLRREYGSHGSIDVISSGPNEGRSMGSHHHHHNNGGSGAAGASASATTSAGHGSGGGNGTSESFFAMLQDYRPAVLGVIGTDQRSPGPAEYLKGKVPDSGNYAAIGGPSSSGPVSSLQFGGAGNALQTSSSITSMQSYAHEMAAANASAVDQRVNASMHYHSVHLTHAASASTMAANTATGGHTNGGQSATDLASDRLDSNGSPKFKLNRLWGPHAKHSRQPTVSANDECSFITTLSADIEERQRRRAFAHFDCQSLTANLGYAAKLRGLLLARRRNTTTGASAASMVTARDSSSTRDGAGASQTAASAAAAAAAGQTGGDASDASVAAAAAADADADFGDGQCNDLIENCPYFRNEIGGEDEREVSLTRFHSSSSSHTGGDGSAQQRRAIHRPALACGVSVLECPAGDSLWKQATCPFQKGTRPIESIDTGARYYRDYFLGQDHQNWFGLDEQLGPVAISIKREKIPSTINGLSASVSALYPADEPHSNNNNNHSSSSNKDSHKDKDKDKDKDSNGAPAIHQFRMIVRTSELLTLRGSVLDDAVPNPRGPGKPATTKDVIEYVAPEVQLSTLRQGVQTAACEQQLLKLDEQGLTNKYKVGILYCKAGQGTEEDMYNNEHAGPAFDEFLDTIGRRVRLRGFEQYRAGLDNKTDSTGTHSLYATMQDCEVMFHVSTMLPFTPNNRQQLLRKRHIGNDIVTIVFQEPGSRPFTPKSIRSQFQHVFVIVRAVNPCTDNTHYRVAVSRSKEVPVFGPPVRAGALYLRSKSFADFLVSKVINAENAAHRSEKFATMATRTRQEYLKDLAANYCTTVPVETGAKFSLFPSKKHKERPRPPFCGDLTQRAAFCWQVVLHDTGQAASVDCFLGISAETFVLIEECSRQIVFVTPCRSILGWSTSGYSMRIFHHQSECVTLSMRESTERDEQLEVIGRLRAVSAGCGAIELQLHRNGAGQLGFHVQPDGVVTQVEPSGQAWSAGLRQGSRLVEICKVAVATLSHDEMVDLLKTSTQVTVTVIESFGDGTPRKGCFLQNCKFNLVNYEGGSVVAGNNGIVVSMGSGGSGNVSGNCGSAVAASHGIGGGGGGGALVSGDYENLDDAKPKLAHRTTSQAASAQMKQPGGASHRRRYERNFSPPRSSNSSGYGTGSSSRSFNLPLGIAEAAVGPAAAMTQSHLRTVADMGTLTSSSSGHSSAGGDDRWYDILEVPDGQPDDGPHGGGGGGSAQLVQQAQQHHHHQQQQQQHQQQQQQHPQQYHHTKISHTSSLPLVNAMRPLSIHEPEKDHSHHSHLHASATNQPVQHVNPLQRHPSAAAVPNHAKVIAVTEQRPLTRPANGNIEYLVKPPTVLSTSSLNSEPVYSVSRKSISSSSTAHNEESASAQQHQQQHQLMSANFTNGSASGHGEMLPLRRASTTSNIHSKPKNANHIANVATSSASSSRNNSPRTLLNESSASSVASSSAAGGTGSGAAKLRPTASAAAARQHANGALLQRNSVNYTGSTLQEDLIRLIHPDYMGASSASLSAGGSGNVGNEPQRHHEQRTSNDDNFHHGPLVSSRPQKNNTNSHSLGNISASVVAALNGGSNAPSSSSVLSAAPAPDELLLMRKKSRSREAINLGSHGMPILGADVGKFKPETVEEKSNNNAAGVIFTTARPATVIIANAAAAAAAAAANNNNNNNNNGSSSDAQHFLHIREDLANTTSSSAAAAAAIRQSTRRVQSDYAAHLLKITHRKDAQNASADALQPRPAALMMPSLPALNGSDAKEVDWSRLVDDAIQQVNEGLKHSAEAAAAAAKASADAERDDSCCDSTTTTTTTLGAVSSTSTPSNPSSNSVPELQSQVVQLEDRIGKETRRRRSLEQAVRRLTEENRRLQDESQAAVQQLRRFTEWFFQTIDRQN